MANSSTNYKLPPRFDESMLYDTWKNELKMWQLVTDLSKPKQALAVSLSLTGKAREIAIELRSEDLNKDDGMKVLTDALDKVFQKETRDSVYEAYTSFEYFKKTEMMSMTKFIIDFEQKYNKMKKYQMELPDAVLAFKLLDSSNLTNTERQLALTATQELSFESMKLALKRVFCNSSEDSNGAGIGIQIKQEAFYGRQFSNKPLTNSFSEQRGTNPLNKYGKRSRCSFCSSVFHWAKDCPDSKNFVKATEEIDEDDIETCNITLYNKSLFKQEESDQEIFVIEAFGSAVLDTACTKTVCGDKWMNNFLENLSSRQFNKIKCCPSNRSFRFGDGKLYYSYKCVTLPIRIGKVSCFIDVEVIDSDIPLLLSRESLKRAGAILNLENDMAVIFGQSLALEFTSSGHYCINVFDFENNGHQEEFFDQVLAISNDLSKSDLVKCLIKLHRQFGHASAERLQRLLKSAGTCQPRIFDILDKVVKQCDVCHRYKSSSPRPVVGLPLASQYNETVAVDLHELSPNVWYLHIIDEFTRFSAACIVRSKQSTVIVNSFLLFWVSVHGAPKKLYSDNGGEFCNKEILDMAENLNIELKTTAGYSPWSNGLLERHNRTLTEILKKVCADNKCSWEIGLAWALMAKNSLINNHGFSPYQLVFGQSPNLPSILVDLPPALEGCTRSVMVGKHISALHEARQAFTESECSEKIRRALRKNTRPTSEPFITGEKVYYKRPSSDEWKGPATVIGNDGVVVFVKHGSSCVRVHQCRLSKINPGNNASKTLPIPENLPENPQPEKLVYDDDEENHEENLLPAPIEPSNVADLDISDFSFKTGQIIKFDLEENGECTAEVMGRAGKATGRNKNWYNIRYLQPDVMTGREISINLQDVDNLQLQSTSENTNNGNVEENMVVDDNVDFSSAKLDELESWKRNGVYIEVENTGQKCISVKWICTVKQRPEGLRPKARLVVRGFEEIDHDNLPKDSPTCSTEALRVILSILAHRQWIPHSMDIKTAFLQGSELSRDIFINPPKEANLTSNVKWKLKKCAYGLSDASLYWYKKVRDVMMSIGGKMSCVDPAVFYWYENGELQGILASHVDDFVWGGTSKFQKKVVTKIRETFQIGTEEVEAFRYVGIEIKFEEGAIFLKQDSYIDNLKPIKIDKTLDRSAELSKEYVKIYRSKIGQILWVARQSRPDIMFDVSKFAATVSKASVQNLFEINKLIGKLKSESVCLSFQQLGEDKDLELVVFSDVSLGNLPDGGSQGGHFIILKGVDGKFSPLCWQSKKIRRAVRSTFAGETLALTDGIDNAVFLSTLFMELVYDNPTTSLGLPITCVIDNKSLYESILSTKCTIDKRLRLEISVIKELIEREQIKNIFWSCTKLQLANCLTKRGASSFQLIKNLNNGVWKLEET